MNIKFMVRTQYREEGLLEPPASLTPEQLTEWEAEAREIIMEGLRSV